MSRARKQDSQTGIIADNDRHGPQGASCRRRRPAPGQGGRNTPCIRPPSGSVGQLGGVRTSTVRAVPGLEASSLVIEAARHSVNEHPRDPHVESSTHHRHQASGAQCRREPRLRGGAGNLMRRRGASRRLAAGQGPGTTGQRSWHSRRLFHASQYCRGKRGRESAHRLRKGRHLRSPPQAPGWPAG